MGRCCPEAAETRAAGSSSRGSTYGFTLKPDLAADGRARAAALGGGDAFVSGTSVAAARVAAAALKLHRLRPSATPAQLYAAVVPASVRIPPRETGMTIQLQVRSRGSPAGFVTGRVTAEAAAGTVTMPF